MVLSSFFKVKHVHKSVNNQWCHIVSSFAEFYSSLCIWQDKMKHQQDITNRESVLLLFRNAKQGWGRKSTSPVLSSAPSTTVIDYVLTFLSMESFSSKNTSVVSSSVVRFCWPSGSVLACSWPCSCICLVMTSVTRFLFGLMNNTVAYVCFF